NRDDVVASAQDPRQGELRRGHAFLGRELAELLGERLVPTEVVPLEPWNGPSEIVSAEFVRGPNLSREESPAQGAVCDEPDAEFPHRGKDFPLRVAGPERILGLERGDRMDCVRAPNRRRGRLRESEVSDLAFVDKF